ncbi:hypothetical protein [Thalassotalea sp. PP2-459]|uniref:hypothetical protein n=1 Tax=Thalassotalea sp. PP2-459 TaxID=1742724 RepID=UPI000942F7D9|nr:hypothetical protein [Thalassotalea sp. PP2-459]OKY24791.1 hypothetical protein BI291_05040 [Thalassotalea sp. PP2-459]
MKRFTAFVDKRLPEHARHVLTHRTIYILPTGFGCCFLGFILLLFVLGTNYQNNLILFVSYLLSSAFIIAMLYSFHNLLGIVVSCQGEYFVQTEQELKLEIDIKSSREIYHVFYGFEQQNRQFTHVAGSKNSLKAILLFNHRGVKKVGRFTLLSEFPLGLFKTWTYVRFPLSVVVYPHPIACQLVELTNVTVQDDLGLTAQPLFEGDDFYALAPYQQGWPLTRVAWKNVAKGQAWQIKQTAHYVRYDRHVLRLADMPGRDLETQLKQLCYLVLDLSYGQQPFSLALDHQMIAESQGEKHSQQCLRLIAQYGTDQDSKTHSSIDDKELHRHTIGC